MIAFTVMGEPQGKGRPRFTKSGITFTPRKTSDYEDAVRVAWKIAGGEHLEGALYATITCYFGVPKSVSKARRKLMLDNVMKPCKKPDADNIAKVILDALNGLAYKDDSSVVQLEVRKFYSDEPRVAVRIGEL